METIINYLSKARLARKQVHRDLALFRLLAREGDKPDYLVLAAALEKGLVKVTKKRPGSERTGAKRTCPPRLWRGSRHRDPVGPRGRTGIGRKIVLGPALWNSA